LAKTVGGAVFPPTGGGPRWAGCFASNPGRGTNDDFSTLSVHAGKSLKVRWGTFVDLTRPAQATLLRVRPCRTNPKVAENAGKSIRGTSSKKTTLSPARGRSPTFHGGRAAKEKNLGPRKAASPKRGGTAARRHRTRHRPPAGRGIRAPRAPDVEGEPIKNRVGRGRR